MKLVGIMGNARSGKTTVGNYLQERYDFKTFAFAESLKNACAEIYGFSYKQLHGDLKETIDEFWSRTPREILQYVGTDLFRTHFRKDIWIKSLERRVSEHRDRFSIVVTDCRFENEMDAIKSWGGEVWKLIRIDNPGVRGGIVSHSSEIELNTIETNKFDHVIRVPTGVPLLLTEVDKILNG